VNTHPGADRPVYSSPEPRRRAAAWYERPWDRQDGAVEQYERLKQLVNEMDDDIRKAEGGNKAAGTRVRQTLQEVKNLAQDMRKSVLEMRKPNE